MTKLQLIELIGDNITQVDVLRSGFARQTDHRITLDDLRDSLDTAQRRIVRNLIQDNTPRFQALAKQIKLVNEELRQTIDDASKIAETLETLVKFVGVVQKIIELIP